jgi:hypothetical protein
VEDGKFKSWGNELQIGRNPDNAEQFSIASLSGVWFDSWEECIRTANLINMLGFEYELTTAQKIYEEFKDKVIPLSVLNTLSDSTVEMYYGTPNNPVKSMWHWVSGKSDEKALYRKFTMPSLLEAK